MCPSYRFRKCSGRPPFGTLFPRGATLNIVGPCHRADVYVRVPNNVENGTSAARDPFPHVLPERSHPSHCLPDGLLVFPEGPSSNNVTNGTSAARGSYQRAWATTNAVKPQASSLKPDCGAAVPAARWVAFRIPNSEFRIQSAISTVISSYQSIEPGSPMAMISEPPLRMRSKGWPRTD
jgi:hypothetical protein